MDRAMFLKFESRPGLEKFSAEIVILMQTLGVATLEQFFMLSQSRLAEAGGLFSP